MKHSLSLAVFSVLAFASATASAGGQAGSIGVGVESAINGETGGVSVNYDAGKFHLGGFFGYADGDGPNNSDFTIGGRFYYHVHSTAMSDFGLGLGLGLASIDGVDMAGRENRATDIFIEPSAQIRLFLASNVALSFTMGLVIATADASGVAFGGQGAGGIGTIGGAAPTALAGVHYYFF
jgi:hypothetical protein